MTAAAPPTLLDVWYSDGAAPAPHALDEAEQERAGRMLCARSAATYRAAHTLKRAVLSHYRPGVDPAAWRFVANAWGKPAASAPAGAPAFNLSHSGDCIAIAIADTDVGIDVERLRPLQHAAEVARHVFHPDELGWLARQPNATLAFLRLWTLKESLLKAVGRGFSFPPRQVCWRMLDARWSIAEFGGRTWRGATRSVDEAILSIALPWASDVGGSRLLRVRHERAWARDGDSTGESPAAIEPLFSAPAMAARSSPPVAMPAARERGSPA